MTGAPHGLIEPSPLDGEIQRLARIGKGFLSLVLTALMVLAALSVAMSGAWLVALAFYVLASPLLWWLARGAGWIRRITFGLIVSYSIGTIAGVATAHVRLPIAALLWAPIWLFTWIGVFVAFMRTTRRQSDSSSSRSSTGR